MFLIYYNVEPSTEKEKEREGKRKSVALFLSSSFVTSTVSHHRNERFCDRTALMTELSLRCFPLSFSLHVCQVSLSFFESLSKQTIITAIHDMCVFILTDILISCRSNEP